MYDGGKIIAGIIIDLAFCIGISFFRAAKPRYIKSRGDFIT